MEKKNTDLLELLEMALETAEEIQKSAGTANLDVAYIRSARDIAGQRAAYLERERKQQAAERDAAEEEKRKAAEALKQQPPVNPNQQQQAPSGDAPPAAQ